MSVIQVEETPRWKKMLGFMGPGFLVSVAYLDPGNLETDLQAGASHKYELLWVVLVGLSFALIIQSRSANLGVATGKHLSEHCKAEYPKPVNCCLWLLAEIAVIAADIPEAFALNILLNIPIWGGVLLAGFNTLLLLALQRYGIKKLECVIASLVLVMGGCFLAEMARAKPDIPQIVEGMFIPRLKGDDATMDAIALLGALIMPHNLFLHSALVMSRKVPQSHRGINSACRYFLMESGLALFIAFLINVAVISVTASVCSDSSLSPDDQDQCEDITLNSAAFLLKNELGKWSSKVYALSLLASGQSSTVTGTFAGQFIMQGFLDMKLEPWVRNLITRCIAITPSLVVSLVGGSRGAGKLIVIASIILSFELPFALIPLLKFTSSSSKMGYHHKNSLLVTITSWAFGLSVIGINMYFLGTTFVGWFLRSDLPKVGSSLVAVVVFPSIAVYVGMLVYLTLRNETVQASATNSPTSQELEDYASM